mmetsp:Transcript_92086/g.298111  ORF Transcript_92086/g.298111 Transcript_92086/m.298111 type:complete len:204 (+) Transcript_92086:441-1052(+)
MAAPLVLLHLDFLFPVDLVVGVRKEAVHQLLGIDATASVLVYGVKQLGDTLPRKADVHLSDHGPKLVDAEVPVLVNVEVPEEVDEIASSVAPLDEPVARAEHEQNPVAVLPDLRKGVANYANGHRHVEHTAQHERGNDHMAGGAGGSHIAIAHSGDRHYGQPHGLRQRLDVVPRLHEVDEGGEGQHEDEEREEQHPQGLQDGP